MQSKLDEWDADKRRDIRNKLIARLEKILRKSDYKRFIHKFSDKVVAERTILKKTPSKKLRDK